LQFYEPGATPSPFFASFLGRLSKSEGKLRLPKFRKILSATIFLREKAGDTIGEDSINMIGRSPYENPLNFGNRIRRLIGGENIMNSRECFVNEEELSLYLDGEIFGARGNALDMHIINCPRCSNRLLVWRLIKSLVRASFPSVAAPANLKHRIVLLLASASRPDGDTSTERVSGDAKAPGAHRLFRDRHSHPGILKPPISRSRLSPDGPMGSNMFNSNRYFDDH
jgi:hypothetical protein